MSAPRYSPRTFPGVLHKMFRQLALVATSTLALVSQVFAADTYPRLGAALYSAPQNYYDTGYQEDIAQLQIAILAAPHPAWGSAQKTSLEKVTQQLKARNPNLKVFLY